MKYAITRLSPLFVCATLGTLSCTDFDREDRIEDTRILAVRTEPAEILYSPLFGIPAAQRPPFLPLPSQDVAVDVLAFDPRGGVVRTTISMCPENASDASCRLYDPNEDLAAEPASARPDIEAILTERTAEAEVAFDAVPVGRTTPTRFDYTFTPNVIDFFIEDDEDGNPVPAIFPLLPRFVVQLDSLDAKKGEVNKERAFKRIPLSLDLTSPDLDPDVARQLADNLGLTLCDAPIPDDQFKDGEQAPCLVRRTPNQNPKLIGFNLEKPDPDTFKPDVAVADDSDLGLSSVLVADPGAQIAVTPVFTEGSVEKYQVVSFDIESSKITLVNRVEDLACSWYNTRGDTNDTLTAVELTNHLGVVWNTPKDAKKGERDSLVMVVLDQRGGTSFGFITVEYK